MKGMRAPGTGIPRVIALETWRYHKGKNFMAVYGKRPAYVITFNLGEFKQWIFTPDNTDEEMETIFRDYMIK